MGLGLGLGLDGGGRPLAQVGVRPRERRPVRHAAWAHGVAA